jgi:CheY-like chemotaxis protein
MGIFIMTALCHPAVLMADDDQDDCLMATEAFADSGAKVSFSCVEDGKELIDRLFECCHSGRGLPNLILLDLNMPRLNGHEALMAIRADEALRNIPVVILTTSSEENVRSSTKKMADGFITKPPSYDGWFLIMKSVADRWLGNAISGPPL